MDKEDRAFHKRLLETFRVEAWEHIHALSAGLIGLEKEADDDKRRELIETIFREAHSLKGAAASLSANDFRDVAFRIERRARAGDGSDLERDLELLQAELDRLVEFAQTF